MKKTILNCLLSCFLMLSISSPSIAAANRQQNPVIQYTVTSTGVTYTQKSSDTVILFTGTGSARALNLLPTATVGLKGQIIYIRAMSDASSNNLTIDPSGSELINGASTYTVSTNYGGVLLLNMGTYWTVLAKF